MQKKYLLASLGLSLFIAYPAAYGVNWQWLEHAPVQSFTEQDWDLFRKNVRSALDTLPDGASSDWTNPASGNGGSVEMLTSNDVDHCRTIKISNQTPKKTGTSTSTLCRLENGNWKIRN